MISFKEITCFIVLFCFCILPLRQMYAQSPIISSEQLQEDVEVLEKCIKAFHPGLYRYQSPTELDSQLLLLRQQFATDQTEGEVLKALAKFTERIKCGHTYPNPWNMKKEIRERLMNQQHYLPLGFKIINRQMVITHHVSESTELSRGTIITAINQIPVATILDSLVQVTKADGLSTTAHRLNSLEVQAFGMRDHTVFDLYFPLFFPIQNQRFDLTYLQNGKTKTTRISALSRSERLEKMEAKYGKAPQKAEKWDVQIRKDGLAILTLSDFAIWSWDMDYKKWLADAFRQIQQQGASALAVDIRGNGGGLSEIADNLLSYLIKQPLQITSNFDQLIATYRPDTSLLKYIQTYEAELKKGVPESYVTKVDERLYRLNQTTISRTIVPKEDAFQGPVFFLADASNSSATFQLLNTVQQNQIAKIVGQAGGGNRQGINGGSYFFLYLPHSGMEIDIPLLYYKPKTQQADAPVQPDYVVELSAQNIAKGEDAALLKVLSLLK